MTYGRYAVEYFEIEGKKRVRRETGRLQTMTQALDEAFRLQNAGFSDTKILYY